TVVGDAGLQLDREPVQRAAAEDLRRARHDVVALAAALGERAAGRQRGRRQRPCRAGAAVAAAVAEAAACGAGPPAPVRTSGSPVEPLATSIPHSTVSAVSTGSAYARQPQVRTNRRSGPGAGR